MLTNYAKKQLKAEQEIKEKERREIVAGRVGEPKDISKLSDGNLILILFLKRIIQITNSLFFSRTIKGSLQRILSTNSKNRE